MNKLFFLLSCLVISGLSFGQVRNVDLSTSILAPLDQAELAIGNTYPVIFAWTNLGPDNLTVGDTIKMSIGRGPFFYNVLEEPLLPGQTDSMEIPFKMDPALPLGANHICFLGIPANGDQISDPDTANNFFCIQIFIVEEAPTNVSAIGHDSKSFSIAPNPALGVVRINCRLKQHGSKKMTITDITGKLIMARELTGDEWVLDISSINPGIYFVEITNDAEKVTGKLMIDN